MKKEKGSVTAPIDQQIQHFVKNSTQQIITYIQKYICDINQPKNYIEERPEIISVCINTFRLLFGAVEWVGLQDRGVQQDEKKIITTS